MPWAWFWNACYVCFIVAASPVLVYRIIVLGKYREGWGEKLRGRLPLLDDEAPTMWLHAVSVGEVLQLEPLLEKLKAARPGWRFVITTTTSTGLQVARRKYPIDIVCYAPLDFSWAVHRAMQRIKPQLIVLVELEIWPNLLATAKANAVPVLLVNGRISARSFRRYKKIRWLLHSTFSSLSEAAVQNDEYFERLCKLGVPRRRLHVTGSIKFDCIHNDRFETLIHELKAGFGIAPDETVFIAGSTQHPEEEIALAVYRKLLPKHPSLRLILVPRHKERFDEVATLIERQGWPLIRRSRQRQHEAAGKITIRTTTIPHIGLLDTLGELTACWGLADIAFVGGSLTRRGGQNMIEPASYGAAVVFGPHTHNFKDVVEMLLSHQAACVVHNAAEFHRVIAELVDDRNTARQMGSRARVLVHNQQGATDRTMNVVLPYCAFHSKNNSHKPCILPPDSLSSGRAA
ncbi:MAG: 3-deoxy-D-manno-octulosonic acid transferase [Planctomycetota bacterium]|nr:3-deoxy-D-manno-octulosonic acid transferase [Planctomycetota bacterium]MDA1214695.1 3-deoxy-D-manno-octulosonic acid transferase [Planctomycetota bacterium]